MTEDKLLGPLSTFRPSDRIRIKEALNRDESAALASIRKFVEGWEDRRWTEGYSVQRIGKWLAVNASPNSIRELEGWSRLRKTEVRLALRKGLSAGKELSPRDKNLLAS